MTTARKEKRKANVAADNNSSIKHRIKEALSLSKQSNNNLHQRLQQQLKTLIKSRISPKQDSKRAKSRKNEAT